MRRVALLYIAMFVVGYRAFTLHIFIALGFFSLIYEYIVQPHEEKKDNLLNILNAFFGLVISYGFIRIQDMRFDPDQNYEIGAFVVYLFYVLAALNILGLLIVSLNDIKLSIKHHYARRLLLKERFLKRLRCCMHAQEQNQPRVKVNRKYSQDSRRRPRKWQISRATT